MPKISSFPFVSQLDADGYMLGIQGGRAVRFPASLFDSTGSTTVSGTFLGNDDTPDSYEGQANKVVAVNATEDGLVFTDPPAQNFLGLTDTPDSYATQSGKLVAVNTAANGVEFVDAPAAVVDSATAPSNPTNGKLWLDTSSSVPVQFLAGGIDGTLIEEKVLTANVSELTFTGLNSLVDGDYILDCNIIGTATADLWMYINGDTTLTNYKSVQNVFNYGDGNNVVSNSANTRPWLTPMGSGTVLLRAYIRVVNSIIMVMAHSFQIDSSDVGHNAFTCTRKAGTSVTALRLYASSGTAVIKAGSVFRLYSTVSASRIIQYSPINLDNFTTDRFLKAGEVAYLNFSNVSSVPLKVITAEGVYEIIIVGDKTGSAAGGGVSLLPNNALTNSVVGRYNNNGGQYQTTTLTYFPIGVGKMYSARVLVSTGVGTKNTVETHSIGDDNNSVQYFDGMFWQSSLVWTSLGTVTFPFAQTGKIAIRRII